MNLHRAIFSSAMVALTLATATCSPDAGLANFHGQGTLQQPGTLIGGGSGTHWSDVGGTFVESSDDQVCDSGRKLLETTSGACLPDGKYDTACDLCCDPLSDARCASARTAEEYETGQLGTAHENAGNAATVAAVSGVVSSVADYFLRTRTTSSQSDRDILCNVHLKILAIYERSTTTVGPQKPFKIKTSSSNVSAELAIRNALLSQKQAARLTYQGCLDPSFGNK
jgi:hypothetical protein